MILKFDSWMLNNNKITYRNIEHNALVALIENINWFNDWASVSQFNFEQILPMLELTRNLLRNLQSDVELINSQHQDEIKIGHQMASLTPTVIEKCICV